MYVRDVCGGDSSKIVYTGFSYFVFSEDKEELGEAVAVVKTTLNNLEFDAQQVLHTTGIRWAQALPLNFSQKIADGLCSEAIMPATSASCLLPIYGDSIGNVDRKSERTGAVFLTRRGAAYNFDPFQSNTNKNGIIFAESGAGKSFLSQYLIVNALAEGTKTFLFDNGRSAEKFCQSVDGEFIEFTIANAKNTSLNPFTGLTQDDFGEQLETITELILKMAYYNEPVGPGARIALGAAVRSAGGDTPHRSSIATVIEALQNTMDNVISTATQSEVIRATADLIPRLNDFMSAPTRGPFFEGQSNLDPKNDFTVFELSSLDGDPHLKQCVLFFVMNTIMNRVKKQEGRKLIVLDEAWQLLKDEGAAASIESMYRKIRKDNGSVWVITQSIADVAGNASGQVILGQSQWKLIMQQKHEVINKAIEDGLITEFTNDPYFIKQIKDIQISNH
jgi:conjugal transfer ATP-binding protein TraC